MPSRRLSDLTPPTRECAELFLSLARAAGFEVLIYCTLRSVEAQARLYRQGRATVRIESMGVRLREDFGRPDLADTLINVGPQLGNVIVTNAAPGQSLHNYGMAFDAVPMRDGKPIWGISSPEDRTAWNTYGELIEAAGLEWAGRWQTLREYPHAQLQGADWRQLIWGEN